MSKEDDDMFTCPKADEWEMKAGELNLPGLTELIGAAEEDEDGGIDKLTENYQAALDEAVVRGYNDEQFATILSCAMSGLISGGWDRFYVQIEEVHNKFMDERRSGE